MSLSNREAARILVVDDTATVAELIKEMLLSFGCRVELCLGVKEALALFEPGKFDLVITDYTMPGMTGVEFSNAIKAKSSCQRVLLITGSAFSMSDDVARALPVDGVLQKPFSANEFEDAVAAALPQTNSLPFRDFGGNRPRL